MGPKLRHTVVTVSEHLDADGDDARPEVRDGGNTVRLNGDGSGGDGDATGVSGAGTTLRGVHTSDGDADGVDSIFISALAMGRGGVEICN